MIKYEVHVLIGTINHFRSFSQYDNAVRYIKEHKTKGHKIISFVEYTQTNNFNVEDL